MDSTISQYTIDVGNKTITFDTAPANHSEISTKVFAISGENYRVLNTFTGDGSTVVFAITNAPTYASELDIFIGGQRLLPTSEDGSTINYDCDGSTAAVTFTTAPASGYQIKILHKRGQVWYTAADGNPANGKGLQASTTAQAKFIADEPTNAPE